MTADMWTPASFIRFPMSRFIASGKLDPIKTDDGMMILPDTTFENCPPLEVICVGGGLGQLAV